MTDMDSERGIHQHHTREWRSHQRSGQGLFRFFALQGHTCNIRRMATNPLNRMLAQVARPVIVEHGVGHGVQ